MITLESRLTGALRRSLGSDARAIPEALRWELPKDPSFGDFSSSVAFKLAKSRRAAPQQIAEELAGALMRQLAAEGLQQWIERIEPRAGYVNAYVSHAAMAQMVRQILRERSRFGLGRAGRAPRRISLEFVSANPTGPLSVAHGRQAAMGDALARLLRSQGDHVTAEFYLNDEGRQVELLGRSLRARCLGLLGRPEPVPEDGYHGAYLLEVARAFLARDGERILSQPEAESLPQLSAFAMDQLLQNIQHDLQRSGVHFDQWSSQRWLRTSGRIEQALEALRRAGALYEADGALWFASTKFGDDKDRVVRKRDGELTYLAPDIAYHQWKFERGYELLLNVWGPDHHGYIPRLKAAVAALGLPADRLTVRIVQLVTLSRRGTPVPMSKRQGEFVTFRELLDEVGVDATRFFFLMRTMESPLDFDLELATSQSDENPVYYVQYAHARICSILAYGRGRLPWWVRWRPDLGLLREPEERLLMRRLFQYPVVLRLCAQALEPHGLTTYLQKLAETFHGFYAKHRVIADDQRRSAARLILVTATRQVLENGLNILGVTAPRRM